MSNNGEFRRAGVGAWTSVIYGLSRPTRAAKSPTGRSLRRQVSETLGARPRRPGAVKRHWAREAIRFSRDVREGMDLYYVRQRAEETPTLGASEDSRY